MLQLRASSHWEQSRVEQARWRMHSLSQKAEIWHTKGCCEHIPTSWFSENERWGWTKAFGLGQPPTGAFSLLLLGLSPLRLIWRKGECAQWSWEGGGIFKSTKSTLDFPFYKFLNTRQANLYIYSQDVPCPLLFPSFFISLLKHTNKVHVGELKEEKGSCTFHLFYFKNGALQTFPMQSDPVVWFILPFFPNRLVFLGKGSIISDCRSILIHSSKCVRDHLWNNRVPWERELRLLLRYRQVKPIPESMALTRPFHIFLSFHRRSGEGRENLHLEAPGSQHRPHTDPGRRTSQK